MKLNGHQIGDLTDILRESFSRGELTILVRTKLEIVLEAEVATDEGWRVVAFNLIDTLNRVERVIELIRAIREARPRDNKLIAFCDPFLGPANGAAANDLRQAVANFRASFKDRMDEFRFLNACKELHDVLHELQNYLPQLKAAVAARAAQPGNPLPDDVGFTLRDWIAKAQQSVADTEFPNEPPAWIARLTAAVDDLTGPDPGKMNRAAERLAGLPSKELGKLNDKLIDYARRLQAGQLIALLDGVRAALPAGAANPEAEALRARVDRFRALCDQLAELIRVHDLCQKVDDALQEARGLATVTPDQLSDWPEVKGWLSKLTPAGKPADFRARRTVEAASQFEAAATQAAFANLDDKFQDLFSSTDKSLLKVTNTLPREAWPLDKALENIQ
jgi:hypothetical protein